MTSPAELMGLVEDALASCLPELAEETCDRIYAELDSYAPVKRGDLRAAVGRNLGLALTALREGVVPSPEELDAAELAAQERYDVGVPVEEIIRGFRVSFSMINERFIDVGMSVGLPVDVVLTGSRLLWNLSDAFSTRLVVTYHALQVGAALADATHRAATVRAVLAGHMPDDATVYGIDLAHPYAAIRCVLPPGISGETVRSRLESTGSLGKAPALVAVDDGMCLGIVATRPTPPDGVTVGLGPFVPTPELPRSDITARSSLELARCLGRTGVQGVEELGWKLAAAARPDVWRLYRDRLLVPVVQQGAFGAEVLAAVRAWLHNGRSIPRAAAATTVHVNTIRYRLCRYCELTGADLENLDDLMGIVWALELPDRTSADVRHTNSAE